MPTVISDASALELLIQDQRELLDTVDDLRSMGVGRIVDLPQIIVVGDQSSGKSSVLEAISLVRFPVKGGLCTRFATELVLRKAQTTKFKVSILAGDPSNGNPRQSLNAGVRRFNEASWDNDDLSKVIEEAKNAMGIGNSDHDFSDHVLRIEIARPEVPSLTLIDLPGFYHGETSEQSANGQKTVNMLARRYMQRKNSIILAIVSGSYGLANQKVLNEARQHDPGLILLNPTQKNPVRTLGILTKPDTIAPGTDDEDKYLQLIQNKEAVNRLDLGWHVLRNRAGNETGFSDEDRDAKEAEFFDQGVWRNIRPGDKGIKSLRSKLSKVLVDHIKRSLPGVREDIERSIQEKRQKLKELGTPRSSPEQIRQYLGEISGKVYRLSTEAVNGTGYSDPFFGDLHCRSSLYSGVFGNARRLRAVVRNLNQAFSAVMKSQGETRSIVWDEHGNTEEDDKKPVNVPNNQKVMMAEYKIAAPTPIHISKLEAEISLLALENLGSQFPGSPNDFLAVQLFRDQSKKWGDIARHHLRLIVAAAKSFTEAVVNHVIAADDKTRETVLVEIVDPFFRSRESILEEKLQELLLHYTMGIPQPLDEDFKHELSSKAKKRLAERVRSALVGRKDITPKDAADAITATGDMTNEYTKVIDMMDTYYKLSLKTFMENVRILAAENCLISVVPSILTPDLVNRMDDERLVALAAESEDIRVERDFLREQLEVLKQGLDKCRRYGGRQSTVSSSTQQTTTQFQGFQAGETGQETTQAPTAPLGHVDFRYPDQNAGISAPLPIIFSGLSLGEPMSNKRPNTPRF
ncbi:Interferon-induced GTP-binding protein Mx2 [Cytospora mali]|uniref:Interferon-induced GTP-binding protein Mx2 n=1 Tax=Cytospora mali TaxID=578113 RepID=A0A194W7F1_CYTMA|nr:Interferon-induced GTP-binding protein Mx2 [Valsa mali]